MERAVRWHVLIPCAILFPLVILAAETSGFPGRFPFRPNLLWCLAFIVSLRVPPSSSLSAFALCGVLRDALLGPRLGSATLAFVIVGWFALSSRLLATMHGHLSQTMVAGLSAFLVSLIKISLDYGPLAYKLVYRIVFLALGDGLLTAAAYVPLAVVLSFHAFSPWRREGGMG